jgi:hypothetical protein
VSYASKIDLSLTQRIDHPSPLELFTSIVGSDETTLRFSCELSLSFRVLPAFIGEPSLTSRLEWVDIMAFTRALSLALDHTAFHVSLH